MGKGHAGKGGDTGKHLRVPNATPSTLSEAQLQKPIPLNNGPILDQSKFLTRSSPSLAIASGIVIPDVYFMGAGLIQNEQSTNWCTF